MQQAKVRPISATDFCSKHGEADCDCHTCKTTCAIHFSIKGELKQQDKGPLLYESKYIQHLDT